MSGSRGKDYKESPHISVKQSLIVKHAWRNMTIQLNQDLYNDFEKICDDLHVKKSDVVRELISQVVSKKIKIN